MTRPFLTALLTVLGAAPAYAQTPDVATSDRVVYEAAFYGQFAPRTAFDMIEQTPGFTLDNGDDRRGFSGAVGNVLIDGRRMSAKSQSVSDVLARVPAVEVARIEVLRGSAVAGDASGAVVLANVVRTPTAGNGTWEGGAEVTNEHVPEPAGDFGWSGRRETTEFSVGGSTYSHKHDKPGSRVVTDGAGNVVAHRDDTNPHHEAFHSLNGAVTSSLGAGSLSVTGELSQSDIESKPTLSTTTPEGAQLESEIDPYDERSRSAEIGVTYRHPVSEWDMELVGLLTREWADADVSSIHFDAAGEQDSVFTQRAAEDSGESIVRATFTRQLPRGRIEAGAEVAINTLDGELELTVDEGAGPIPIDIPNANLRVTEDRGEAFVSYVWNADERWSLDARLAAEASRLRFTGDTEQSVALDYVKPRLQLTRKLGAHQLQARAYRDVGQLDFSDFVSSAELRDDLIEGGNPDLKPQTAWVAELEADLRFRGDAALRVRAFHQWLDDVVDLIPVGPPDNQFDAPGNIGTGTLVGVAVSMQLPLGKLLPGGTFELTGTLQDSEVRDPVTHELRDISDFSEDNVQANLRQDLTAMKLAWGVSYTAESADTDYRLEQADRFRAPRRLDGFIETSAIASLKVRLSLFNLLEDTEERDRRFYSPDRTGTLVLRETTTLHPGFFWSVAVSGRF